MIKELKEIKKLQEEVLRLNRLLKGFQPVWASDHKANYVEEEVPPHLSYTSVWECKVPKGSYFACYFGNCTFEEGSQFSGCGFSGENLNNFNMTISAIYGD